MFVQTMAIMVLYRPLGPDTTSRFHLLAEAALRGSMIGVVQAAGHPKTTKHGCFNTVCGLVIGTLCDSASHQTTFSGGRAQETE
jgi:hypothetical protein